MAPTIQTGSVFARSFSALTTRLGPLYGSVLVIYLPLIGALLFVGTLPASEETTLVLTGLGVLGFALLAPLASAAVIRGVFLHLRGRDVGFDDCWRGLGKLWLRVLVVSILVGVATIVGYMLCVIPGFIIQAGLFVSIPALVVEHTGIADALDRSWKLTEGHRMRIFFIVVGLVLLSAILGFLLGLVLSLFGVPAMVKELLTQLLQSFLTALQAVVAGVVYFDLRELREGLDLDDLASVFD
jgi:hypothetical protein